MAGHEKNEPEKTKTLTFSRNWINRLNSDKFSFMNNLEHTKYNNNPEQKYSKVPSIERYGSSKCRSQKGSYWIHSVEKYYLVSQVSVFQGSLKVENLDLFVIMMWNVAH